ncbi:MAG TPA: HupE/UreJ family protein [Solimonas sp.]|nr:HupE/UreJ family protein [Solimonas sp.]
MRPEPRQWLVLLALLAALPAAAHNRSVSYSTWTVEGTALQADLRLGRGELNRLGLDPRDPASPEAVSARVREGFAPVSADGACQPGRVHAQFAGSLVRVEARWHCPGPPIALRSAFLLDAVPGHLHLAQLRTPEGVRGPHALTAAQDRISLAADAPPRSPGFTRFLALGGEHILLGWDHLAFLVVLLLGAASLRQLAWRITGFTLGHSLTLALATLGAVRPPAVMVESFIALTIACTAAERLLAGTPLARQHAALMTGVLALAGGVMGALPPALVAAAVLLSLGAVDDARLDSLRTALFGLFHGFGFAGVLGELNAGQAVPALPLAGFNLGVELGQLLFVIPLWILMQRWPGLRSPGLAAAILALGSAAFLARIV